MSQTQVDLNSVPRPTDERRGPTDRRLGERRLQLRGVAEERRAGGDRRRPVGRRESPSSHLRNAIQVLETALLESERGGDRLERSAVVAAVERLRQALREVDRLADDRSRLGRLLRVTERGLLPHSLPGLRPWLT